MSALPLPYRVPLDGTVLIEASAGTGKTHTLERLIARHLLWNGHAIDSILAVTFTRAAAADIKLRLHAFLMRCRDYDGVTADGDIEFLFRGRPAEVGEAQLRARLSEALADFDRATVYTIHGFCQHLLQDHALECGQTLPAPALLEDETALRLQVCEEFWRRCGQDPEFSDMLDALFGSPQRLAGQLPELLSAAALKPDRPVLAKPDSATAFAALQSAYRRDGAGALPVLLAAINDGTLNKRSHKADAIEKSFADLERFLATEGLSRMPDTAGLCSASLTVNKAKPVPEHPFLDALVPWNRFMEAMAAYRGDCKIFLYHALRDYARTRLSELKSQAGAIGFDDIIDAVHRALAGDSGEALARKIRKACPVALVDEFQDTDERQWRIFECIYRNAAPASLILIGDPKQAIYGFRGGDIHTYLKVQALADHRETLDRNYRSNQALLDGIAAVFQARNAQPFPEPGIAFSPIMAGHAGQTLFVDQQPVPAVAFFGPGCDRLATIGEARLVCAQQCADSIAELLNRSRLGNAVLRSGERHEAVLATDIAVLVSRHSEAALIQNQLQQRGVPAVCVSRENLFEAHEALDILQVLQAIEHPSSDHALATACSGLLVRCAISDTVDRPDWQVLAQRLIDQGPLSAFGSLLDSAQRALLARPDGERRLGNYLHVLERMQSEFKPLQGARHYLDWIGRQISMAHGIGTENSSRPRLESSKPRVRIMTLHQSKGLEFGMVFLPFTAIRPSGKSPFARYFQDGQRCLHLDPGRCDAAVKARIIAEQASENLRLLYVGMTRAKFGLRCAWGAVKELVKTPLGQLLLAEDAVDGAGCADALRGFSYSTDRQRVDALPAAPAAPATAPIPAFSALPAAWQITSFSGLHRGRENALLRPVADESAGLPTPAASLFKGADFGNALHLVLEHARVSEWPDGQAGEPALRQCRQALLAFGYSADLAVQGAPFLAMLAGNALLAPLPEGIRLLDLPVAETRHELEFHLKLAHADASEILAALQRRGYCRQRTGFGFNQVLNGLLTGKIDLLYRHAGKVHIVDYKSNTLPDYAPETLRQSVQEQEYDLQYLLYTVAVHRWLALRVADYAYGRHFGGIRYLYARGIDPAVPGSGLFIDLPEEGLIHELDRCFSPEERYSG